MAPGPSMEASMIRTPASGPCLALIFLAPLVQLTTRQRVAPLGEGRRYAPRPMAEHERISDARSIWELVERRAAVDPDRLMLVDERDRTLTFGEFRDRAERVAAGLHEL